VRGEWQCAGCDLATDDWDVMDAHILAVQNSEVLQAQHQAHAGG
jgi:hypothetical protein